MELASEEIRVLVQVAFAMALGGLIGLERELAGKPAGLRTLILVAGVSALLVDLSRIMIASFEAEAIVRPDPVRVIQAIVLGISFLGAGTIFRSRDGIEGLTTAASVLVASAVGICVGAGRWKIAVGTTLLVLLALVGFGALEDLLHRFTGRRAPRKPGDARPASAETTAASGAGASTSQGNHRRRTGA